MILTVNDGAQVLEISLLTYRSAVTLDMMSEIVQCMEMGDDPDELVRILVLKEGVLFSVHFEIVATGTASPKTCFPTEGEAIDHMLFLSDQFAYTRIDPELPKILEKSELKVFQDDSILEAFIATPHSDDPLFICLGKNEIGHFLLSIQKSNILGGKIEIHPNEESARKDYEGIYAIFLKKCYDS